jgi:hypothetical protein
MAIAGGAKIADVESGGEERKGQYENERKTRPHNATGAPVCDRLRKFAWRLTIRCRLNAEMFAFVVNRLQAGAPAFGEGRGDFHASPKRARSCAERKPEGWAKWIEKKEPGKFTIYDIRSKRRWYEQALLRFESHF